MKAVEGRRVVMIHQPHLLPWLGYFNKLLWCDEFIALDDVQFRRSYYQNRTLLKSMQGRATWFTIPVHAARLTRLPDVFVASRRWLATFEHTVQHYYGRSPHFQRITTALLTAASRAGDRLVDIDLDMLRAVLELLNWRHVNLTLASHYGRAQPGEDRIAALCLSSHATHYIYGEGGGARRHSPTLLTAVGVRPVMQDFQRHHPVYHQPFGPFIAGLSIIDALSNIGPEVTADLLRAAWQPTTAGGLAAANGSTASR